MTTEAHSPAAPAPDTAAIRIGLDLGGTKIAGIALARDGAVRSERRIQTPRNDYRATIDALAGLAQTLAADAGTCLDRATVGIGMPGSIAPASGRVQNANSTWLNGRDLSADLTARLGRPVRLANDANCFALSEATDGAARGCRVVFGVIAGTGLGGGIVVDGRLLEGRRAAAGEWGHNPLPWANADELPGPRCWCGLDGCLEAWVCGPALSADHARRTGRSQDARDIEAAARAGDAAARATLDAHADRFARGLAHIANIIDPDCVVLGGGLSGMPHLYQELPARMAPYLFAESREVSVRPPRWGDASGVRGAAWLWDDRTLPGGMSPRE